MRAVSCPLFLLAALAALAVGPGPVRGSFECLPGPAPGGLSDWTARRVAPAGGARGWSGSLSLGRPASIDRLVWSHALAGWGSPGFQLFGETYLLSLEEIYGESVLGLWVSGRGLAAGLRRWQVGWGDGTTRSGWSGSASLRLRRGALGLQLAAQDLALGRRDAAAPGLRIGGGLELRTDATFGLAGRLFHAATGWGGEGELLWTPLPRVTLRQVVRFPDEAFTTGLEIGAGRAAAALWIEPASRLGPRIGIGCTFGSSPWGP